MYTSCKLWYLCAYFQSSLPPSKICSTEILDILIIFDINMVVLVHFHLCLNKEIHPHLLPHISYACIPSTTLGTVWLPWQLHPAVKEGRRKRAQAAMHRNSAERITATVVSAENYRRGISTTVHLPRLYASPPQD